MDMVKINGESYDYVGLSVAEMLERNGFSTDRIAVEINEEIVPKANYSTVLKDEDTVEVVSFVGGG